MTQSYWQQNGSSLSSDLSCDTVIVGGGFVGLSTAYWLTELRPDLKIIIIERGQCGAGASGRNAGFLTKGSAVFYHKLLEKWGEKRALSLYHFAAKSLQLLNEKILSTSPAMNFKKATSVTFLRDNALSLPESFEFSLAKQSAKYPRGVQAALVSQNEYQVNPMELIDSLKTKLQGRNVQILEDHTGFHIGEELVLTSKNKIKCKTVILALNGFTSEFAPALASAITPTRAQMLAVEISPDSPWQNSLYYDPSHRVYFRNAANNILLIGGKRLLDEKGESCSNSGLSAPIQAGLEDYLREELSLSYKVLHRWSGIMGFTSHELPYISEVKGPTRAILVAGFSGHGMGFGFHSGKEAAELSLGIKKLSFFADFGALKGQWSS